MASTSANGDKPNARSTAQKNLVPISDNRLLSSQRPARARSKALKTKNDSSNPTSTQPSPNQPSSRGGETVQRNGGNEPSTDSGHALPWPSSAFISVHQRPI